ncbi:MAG: hypothetical protein WKG07_00235 [Hymenobacter sp.]
MKKLLLLCLATAALASCREANTGVQSRPTAASPTPDKSLRLDTTFVKTTPGLRTYPHTYSGNLLVGEGQQVAVPLEINWTTVEQAGCAQVASVRVYQLNAADRRTKVSVQALRDAMCRPGQRADGSPDPTPARPTSSSPPRPATCTASLPPPSPSTAWATTIRCPASDF